MSRILLHSLTTDTERGQVASLYQLVLLAAAPLGSFACGLIMQLAGTHWALQVIALCSALVFGAFLLSRTLWSIKQVGQH